MRLGSATAFVLIGLALFAPPRGRAAPQVPPPPVFGTGVDVVRLDVLVLDEDGRPVTGLSREDFEIEEGGRPQPITSFEPVVVGAGRPARPEPQRIGSARLRAPSEGRCVFLYVDDLHVNPTSMPRIREAIRRFLENDVREGDWVTLVAPEQELWWTARNGWEYRELATVAGRLTGQGGGDTHQDWAMVTALEEQRPGVGGGRAVMSGGTPGDAGGRPPGVPGGSGGSGTPADEAVAGVGKADAMFLAEENVALVKRRTGIALAGLRQAIESLVALRGRKSLVLISEGFLLLPRMSGYAELIDVARRANVAIHVLDPRGLETGLTDASSAGGPGGVMAGTALTLPMLEMEGLASVTGGHVFGPSDAETALRRVAAESDAYYLLGYAPEAPKSGERRVEVRVRREGLRAVARRRYFVPVEDPAKPASPRPTLAHAAMRSLADATELPLRVATLFFEANRKGEVATMLATEAVPPPGRKGERLFKLVSEARARDGGPAVRDQFEGSPDAPPGVPVILARQWYLPPGVWQVRLLVEDTTTGRVGTLLHTFEVPDPKALRLSTPILTAELADPEGQRKPKVALGRTFRTGSMLYCQFSVYGASVAGKHDWTPHALAGWTLRRGDEVVREAPLTLIRPGDDGRLTRTLGISLQGAPPGEYALTLTVKDEKSGETLSRTEPFTVAP
jgi:VWFA-related protein